METTFFIIYVIDYYLKAKLLIAFTVAEVNAQVTQATNAVTNGNSYLGTSNDFDVLFKRNNLQVGKISTNSVYFGSGAGSNSVGTSNSFLEVVLEINKLGISIYQ